MIRGALPLGEGEGAKHAPVKTKFLHIFAPDDANSQIANAEARGKCFAPCSEPSLRQTPLHRYYSSS